MIYLLFARVSCFVWPASLFSLLHTLASPIPDYSFTIHSHMTSHDVTWHSHTNLHLKHMTVMNECLFLPLSSPLPPSEALNSLPLSIHIFTPVFIWPYNLSLLSPPNSPLCSALLPSVFSGAICLTAAESNSRLRTVHHFPTRYVHSMCAYARCLGAM